MKLNIGGKLAGEKKKKPFFLRWWFILVVIIVICAAALSSGSDGEKVDWNEMVLGEMLPEPPAEKGDIWENSDESLRVDLTEVSPKEYSEYVSECKGFGFNIEPEKTASSYTAYNEEGYKLKLDYYDSNEELSIELELPIEMAEINWPDSLAGNQLPKPKSTKGNFSFEYDDNFFVYIGETNKEAYNEYVEACSEKGFKVDYDKGENYYYADNSEGWHISLKYQGNNIMSIEIDAPAEEDTTKAAVTEKETEKSENVTETTEKATEDDGLLSSDFKTAMDSYEKFMGEYVDFMKKYEENPDDLSLIVAYADYMKDYAEFVEDFEKWEDEEMNAAETAYYIDVQARVNKKLLEIAE